MKPNIAKAEDRYKQVFAINARGPAGWSARTSLGLIDRSIKTKWSIPKMQAQPPDRQCGHFASQVHHDRRLHPVVAKTAQLI